MSDHDQPDIPFEEIPPPSRNGETVPGDRREDPCPDEAAGPLPSPAERHRLAALVAWLESSLPARYRAVVLEHLLPGILGHGAIPGTSGPADDDPTPDRPPRRLDTAPYERLVRQRGRVLDKALAGLLLGDALLGIEWMTPREIVELLAREVGAESLYRSNVSSALGDEEAAVIRRRRGRGFEYALTRHGRQRAHRALRLG